jgi:hypothetical protein
MQRSAALFTQRGTWVFRWGMAPLMGKFSRTENDETKVLNIA